MTQRPRTTRRKAYTMVICQDKAVIDDYSFNIDHTGENDSCFQTLIKLTESTCVLNDFNAQLPTKTH